MNTQFWRYPIAALLIVASFAPPTVTQATMITRTFSDTGLSGTFDYDDTSIIAGSGQVADWTFSAIDSFHADFTPEATSWDISDFQSGSVDVLRHGRHRKLRHILVHSGRLIRAGCALLQR